MARTNNAKNANELTGLLKRINEGVDPSLLTGEATRLYSVIGPSDLATAEQNLIEAGISPQLAHQLASEFISMNTHEKEASRFEFKSKLPGNHVLRQIHAEHELLSYFMAELSDVTEKIIKKEQISDTSSLFRRYCHIVEHLDAMAEHIEREEDIIFPYLARRGWKKLTATAAGEHMYIKMAVEDLIRLLGTIGNQKPNEYKTKLGSVVSYLVPAVRDHIFLEDNIIYPLALEIIDDESVWDSIKDICDEIGYCGVHL
jgi:DUF438 domain-containing protein